jgi:hypothetical protein
LLSMDHGVWWIRGLQLAIHLCSMPVRRDCLQITSG